MRKRTLTNGAIIGAVLATMTGLGIAIANAATTPSTPTAGPSASITVTTSPSATATVTTSASATASATVSASSSSSDGSQCESVFLVTAPAGSSVGKLCATIDHSGTTVSGVTVAFTPSGTCSGSVMLRVSGIDSTGAEFDDVKTVSCTSGKASGSFTPASKVTAGHFLCGTLLSDTYTAAQACVAIS